jgi:hypothetical protein
MEGMEIKEPERYLSEGFVRKERIEGKVNCEVALNELVMLKVKLDLFFLDAWTSREVRAKPSVSESMPSKSGLTSAMEVIGSSCVSVL